jgi:hypothetical protein
MRLTQTGERVDPPKQQSYERPAVIKRQPIMGLMTGSISGHDIDSDT